MGQYSHFNNAKATVCLILTFLKKKVSYNLWSLTVVVVSDFPFLYIK